MTALLRVMIGTATALLSTADRDTDSCAQVRGRSWAQIIGKQMEGLQMQRRWLDRGACEKTLKSKYADSKGL